MISNLRGRLAGVLNHPFAPIVGAFMVAIGSKLILEHARHVSDELAVANIAAAQLAYQQQRRRQAPVDEPAEAVNLDRSSSTYPSREDLDPLHTGD